MLEFLSYQDDYTGDIILELQKREEPITPDEFCDRMEEYRALANIDPEIGHYLGDILMKETLAKLGYSDGTAVFDEMIRYYG